jgi:predicted MFS family arabinose efflux permease
LRREINSGTPSEAEQSTVTESITARADPAHDAAFPWAGLLALAAAVFLSITGELLPAGLLPQMSRDLDVDAAMVGLLITVFAFTVVLTSAPLTALTRSMPRRRLLVVVLVGLAAATAFSALAPSYPLLLVARVLGGIAHGMFWTVVAAYAGDLVPAERVGRAVSITLGGGTAALVLGIPLATSLGQAIGWRPVFAVTAVLMLVCAVFAWRLLPEVRRGPAAAAGSAAAGRGRTMHGGRSIRAVLIVCAVTAITMVGQYAVYTFVAPLLTDHVGIDEALVGPMLFVYGIAGAAGLVIAGTVLARRPTPGLVLGLAVTAAAAVIIACSSASPLSALFAFIAWGIAFGLIPPLLQTRVLQTASTRMRDLASALYTTAFNAGIGGGALAGALIYDGAGLIWLPISYAIIAVIAIVAVLAAARIAARHSASSDRSGHGPTVS